MTYDLSPIFPLPPRSMARHENRGTAVVIFLSLLILIGISVLIPALNEEDRVAKRRERVWNEGHVVEGVIETKNRSQFGRKEVRYKYRVNGDEYIDERVITHVDDFELLEVGGPITLRFDPKDPEFSVIALDVTPSFEDWFPTEFLIGIIFVCGGLMVLWGYHRRSLLRNGIEVPCTVHPTSSPNLVRVRYTWHDVTRARLVEGKCISEGEPGTILLNPAFPSWPLLGMHDRFSTGGGSPSSSMHGIWRRWERATLAGTVGAWVMWGLITLMTGESMSPHLRTACILVVGVGLTFIGSRSDSDEHGQVGSASDNELEKPPKNCTEQPDVDNLDDSNILT